ncbi:MAG: septal ring lytic transglycosylase RlpA family protein, partial [Thermoleophilaceae bacterium]
RFTGDRVAAAATSKSWRLYAYRSSFASWYGPGLYGNKLGCGGTLSRGTLGVANKSLPCGTKVKFRYRGRSVTVRVVDRGPYVGGRVWDLTAATKAKLGFPSTGSVWSNK